MAGVAQGVEAVTHGTMAPQEDNLWSVPWLAAVTRAWRVASGNGSDLVRDVRAWGHQLWSAQPRLVTLAAVGTLGGAALLLTWAHVRRRRSHQLPPKRRRPHLLEAPNSVVIEPEEEEKGEPTSWEARDDADGEGDRSALLFLPPSS